MARLVRGAPVLEPPHLDLPQQRKRRAFPIWVRLRHLKKAFSDRIRSPRRNGVCVSFRSVRTSLQKRVLDRAYQVVRNTRPVVAQHAEASYKISLSLKARECLCEQLRLTGGTSPFARRKSSALN